MDFGTAAFWIALGQIIVADLLLAGDNAVVIALAVRALPAAQQKKAIIFGTAAAVIMRIALTVVAAQLLTFPYLKLVGAVLLLYVAVGLLLPDHEDESAIGERMKVGSMSSAIRTILIADLVMSLDNVIAVAAASRGDTFLLITGLVISIPLVVYGSTLLLKVIERYPAIVWGGAALLGYVAGDIAMHDPAIEGWATAQAQALGMTLGTLARLVGIAGALLVVAIAWIALKRRAAPAA
ncbi:MAG TPA: TerC family protein [Burkholderiaceae bacterium]|nr:TerC family protein [Burkholderiaceae bacterium]